jgi:hypothetical protein
MTVKMQERIGCLVAAAGVVWAAQVLTANFATTTLFRLPPAGPIEVCGAGVVIWLTAKWRRSITLK